MATTSAIVLASWIITGVVAQSFNEGDWIRAEVAPQFSKRQTNFAGGWPQAISGSTCPNGLTKCQGIINNPSCCPSGSTCGGVGDEFCCPDGVDCEKYLMNFPQCADPANVMYVLRQASKSYFCCPVGQFGVLPISGYGGFCQENGTPVDPTRVATRAKDQKTVIDFVTTVPVTGTTRTTLPGGAVTTVPNTFSTRTTITETKNVVGPATTVTGGGTANTDPANQSAGSPPTDGATNNNSNNGGGGGGGVSAGTIAGIVIGALAVIAIFTLAFVLYRRKKPAAAVTPTSNPPFVGGNSPESNYTGYAQPNKQGPEMTNYPIPVTPGSTNVAMTSNTSGYGSGSGTLGSQNAGDGLHVAPPPPANEPSWGTRAELGGGR